MRACILCFLNGAWRKTWAGDLHSSRTISGHLRYYQIGIWLHIRLESSFLFCSKEMLPSGSSKSGLLCEVGKPGAEDDSKASGGIGLTNPTRLVQEEQRRASGSNQGQPQSSLDKSIVMRHAQGLMRKLSQGPDQHGTSHVVRLTYNIAQD